MAGTGGQDGFFDNVILRPAERPLIKRSTSTHGREQRPDASEVIAGPQGAQAHRPSKRSASAERGRGWVAAPVPRKEKENRFVALPLAADAVPLLEEETEGLDLIDLLPEGSGMLSPTGGAGSLIEEAQYRGDRRGRILVMAACETFERENVCDVLKKALPFCVLTKYSEVLHMAACSEEDLSLRRASVTDAPADAGDVFIFDFGVVILWGLDEPVQDYVLKVLKPCQIKSFSEKEAYREQLAFHYTADQPPHIQNDCITISKADARNAQVKIAISHALAQSAKLHLYEDRVTSLVEQVRYLPESLAKYGEIRMSRQKMARLQGQVFILKSEVNLLSSVMDIPDFFWTTPDALRSVYDKVLEYVELSSRIELVNSRIMLMQSMLHIWSDHKAHHHLVRLDRIVIILIIMEVIIAGAEVLGFFMAEL